MQPVFKTRILIHQSKANLDEKILFGEITLHLSDPEIRKMMAKGLHSNENSMFHLGQ